MADWFGAQIDECARLRQVFIVPLRHWLQEAKQRSSQGENTGLDSLVQQDVVQVLFSNLEQLIDFNRQLLSDLKKLGTETEESMAEVIAKTAPFLKVWGGAACCAWINGARV